MAEDIDQYSHSYLNDPDSELFSNTTVERFLQQAEQEFASGVPCIDTRIALNIVSGTSTYTLPDDVVSIRRVTWQGLKLDPLPARNFRDVFQRASQGGKPFWYVYNNIGLNTIRLFPTPQENLSSTTNDLWGAEIGNRCIVHYWRTPDFSTYVIPTYFRRRLLKSYMLHCCFLSEGPGQNLKLSQYHKNRWLMLKDLYKLALGELHNKPRKLVVQGITSSYYFPGQPILPVDRFGTSVDIGE